MRLLLLLTALLTTALTTNSYAQKPDKINLGTYSYVQLPINTVLIHFNNYRVEGIAPNGDSYKRDAIVSRTVIEGFDKKRGTVATDFLVKVEEYPLQWGEVERHESTDKYKDDGIEKTRKMYTYSQEVSHKYVLIILNNAGEIIYEKVKAGITDLSSGKYSSSKSAFDKLKSERNSFTKNVTTNELGTLLRDVNNQVGYPVKSVSIKTAIIKAKKHNYDDYDAAFELFKKGYEVVAANEEAVEDATEHFTAAIAGFEKMLEEADVENKKARVNEKVATVLYLNIALSYGMMRDYDKAIEYFTKGQKLNKNFGAMNTGINTMKSRKKRLEANLAASNQER